MKICADHWKLMREAVESRGLMGLVAKSGEAAAENEARQLEEAQSNDGKLSDETVKDTFDPLMSMHWHYANNALRLGGLYLLGQDQDGNAYCPVCEFVKHSEGFDAKTDIESIADQQRAWCIEQKLIPGNS